MCISDRHSNISIKTTVYHFLGTIIIVNVNIRYKWILKKTRLFFGDFFDDDIFIMFMVI